MMTRAAEQQLILISGGSRGLGLALAQRALADGHAVVTFSRRRTDALEALLDRHREMTWVEGDLGDAANLPALFRRIEKAAGTPTALINNAAIAPDGLLALQDDREIARMVNINVTGTVLLTKLAVKRMMVRRAGAIVSISSIVGTSGHVGVAPYSATKAAVIGLTRALAKEVGPRGIRVNAVAPGFLRTDMVENLSESQVRRISRRTPLGRLGEVEDVVGAVFFLLSDEARFITGQTLVIDGGLTC